MVEAEAARQGADAKLAVLVAEQESQFGRSLNSPAGARGIMQLMLATAQRYGVREICDPADNIRGGIAFLKDLTAAYGGNVMLTLAAYNAGEARVKSAKGVPAIAETVRYVAKGANAYYGLAAIASPTSGPSPMPAPPTINVAEQRADTAPKWIGGSVLYLD